MNSGLRQFPHRDCAQTQHVPHDLVHATGVTFLNKGSSLDALLQPKNPRHLKAAQRLSQDVAADAELLSEIALRRQLVARLKDAKRQLFADPLADFLKRAPCVNRPKRHRAR